MAQSFIKEYRASSSDSDGGTKLMLIAAAGLGAILLVGMAGWAFMGRPAAVVPVIEADSRPIRVKPENPGGMQVVGADDGANDGRSVKGMAPAAEAPAPQALRAQLAPPPRPAPPVATSPAAPPPPALVAAAVVSPPMPATPVVARAPAVQPAPATRPVAPAVVQLAALDSEPAARAEWARLQAKLPDLLGQRAPALAKADREGKTIWRVRLTGFTDVAEATRFCSQIRAKGAACTLAF